MADQLGADVSAAGYAKFAHRTQLTGFVSFGFWSNDEPLLPFTINAALPVIALPRTTAQAEARVFSTNLNLVSRPATDWEFSARVRDYDYNNQTPATVITQYVTYDTSVGTSATGGPELYAHSRTTFDADATWTGLQPLGADRRLHAQQRRLRRSHLREHRRERAAPVGRCRRLAVDDVPRAVRVRQPHRLRAGRGAARRNRRAADMRHYDLADRTRNQFTGIVDFVPDDRWTFSVSGGVGKDNYPDSYFGLQETTFRTVSVAADFREPNGFGAGGNYNFERYSGLQRSRSAEPGTGNRSEPRLDRR